MPKAMIVKSISNLFTVEYNNKYYDCNASTKLKRYKKKLIIGDFVEFEMLDDNRGYIIGVDKRTNQFTRPKVANVKHALLVFSIKEPNMNWNLLDKFLVSCENNLVNPIIVITKIDLVTKEELKRLKNKISYYQRWYNVLFNDASDITLQIKKICQRELTFLMGQSGVGKSTLLNNIDPNLNITTNDISLKLNRGKHTTRHTQLYSTNELNIIDTPGFGMLMIDSLSVQNIKSCFIDFFELSSECKFGAKCNHISEINCSIKRGLIEGNILQSRYDSYIELYQEALRKKW